jgi:maltooligosyltrehalose trehalohydrolase
MWNDDWHHSAHVALIGRREAYYTDYRGTPQEFVSMAKHGFLYQGQWYSWQKNPRGTPSLHLPPRRFICYLQNHDQVANSARGERLHRLTSRGRHRAMIALQLLQPQLPMLFQGEEIGSSKPFLYFADHKPELAEAVSKGRAEFLEQFPSIKGLALAPPHARETFEACKLDWDERDEEIVELYRTLLRLRRDDDPLVGGAVLSDEAFLLRWPERLLIINLGRDLHLDVADEPLLAPPLHATWAVAWSSEAPADVMHVPAESAVLFSAAAGVPDR